MTTPSIRFDATVENNMLRVAQEQPARFRFLVLKFLQQAGWLVAGIMREVTAPQLKHYPQLGAPHPGGALVASIRPEAAEMTRGGTGGIISIGPNVPYDVFVDQGTRAHVIRPTNAKALAFIMGGRVVLAHEVHHPGFAGYHFTEETTRIATPKVELLAARIFLGDGGVSLA